MNFFMILIVFQAFSFVEDNLDRMKPAFPSVLRATAFAPAALSLLAARLPHKTAAFITPLKSVST
jgi:hypothetical protein